MNLQPYLFFDGRCEEAMEFYKSKLGAKEQMLMRYKQSPVTPSSGPFPAEMMEKVMHASLRIGDSTMLLSDGHCTGRPSFSGFSISLIVSDEAEAERLFAVLSEGGKVTMPIAKTFFSSRFGMVNDRFGVGWMILVQSSMAPDAQ